MSTRCMVCEDCGTVLDEYQLGTITTSHGSYSTCPCCGGAVVNGYCCIVCQGSVKDEFDLYEGYCETCLRSEITYDLFLEYLVEDDRVVEFMMQYVFESSVPDKVSDKFREVCRELFLRRKADDRVRESEDFLNICQDFVFDFDNKHGAEEFAEWLVAGKR